MYECDFKTLDHPITKQLLIQLTAIFCEKDRELYLKIQFVPRSEHTASWL
jgi:hypothetical protein